MKSGLRWLAMAVVLVALAMWAVQGASRGWTKTSVPVKITDEVTGIEAVTYQKKFVPGLDFLAASAAAAGLLAGVAFFLPAQKKHA